MEERASGKERIAKYFSHFVSFFFVMLFAVFFFCSTDSAAAAQFSLFSLILQPRSVYIHRKNGEKKYWFINSIRSSEVSLVRALAAVRDSRQRWRSWYVHQFCVSGGTYLMNNIYKRTHSVAGPAVETSLMSSLARRQCPLSFSWLHRTAAAAAASSPVYYRQSMFREGE